MENCKTSGPLQKIAEMWACRTTAIRQGPIERRSDNRPDRSNGRVSTGPCRHAACRQAGAPAQSNSGRSTGRAAEPVERRSFDRPGRPAFFFYLLSVFFFVINTN